MKISEMTEDEVLVGARQVRQMVMTGLAPVPDFAKGIDVSTRTVHNYVSRGMPSAVIGKRRYIVTEQAVVWLRNPPPVSAPPPPRPVGRPRKQSAA
jgi:hypothetical protein